MAASGLFAQLLSEQQTRPARTIVFRMQNVSDVWQANLKTGEKLVAVEIEARPKVAASSDGGQGPARTIVK